MPSLKTPSTVRQVRCPIPPVVVVETVDSVIGTCIPVAVADVDVASVSTAKAKSTGVESVMSSRC